MFKNVASQSVALFAFDYSTGAPKTGDSAQMIFYVDIDFAGPNAIAASSGVPTEISSSNQKGWYKIALSQSETNGNQLHFTGKSTTGSVAVVGQLIQTVPNRFGNLVIDSSFRVDATAVMIGPSGSATALAARDIGTSVLLSSGTGTGQLSFTSGVVQADAAKIGGTAQTGADLGAGVTILASNRPGIRKNTALTNFEILMTDSTNHNPATGLTVSITRSIDGGSFSAGTLSAVSAVGNGIYKFDFGAGDLNGDIITLRATATAADDTFVTIRTSP